MPEKIRQLFDGLTTSYSISAGAYGLATLTWDVALTRSIGILTLILGACKLYEMVTGKKFSDLFKSK